MSGPCLDIESYEPYLGLSEDITVMNPVGGRGNRSATAIPRCKWYSHAAPCGDMESYEPSLGLSEDITYCYEPML